jgi:hypothetical protein
MNWWQKLCWKYGVYWYQNWDGQLKIDYQKITYGVKGKNDTIQMYEDQLSPYYFNNYFEYAFEVTNQEDRDTIQLRIVFTISGTNDNPHISDIEHANVFTKIYSTVQSKAAEVIANSRFHTLTTEFDDVLQKIKAGSSTVNPVQQDEDEIQDLRKNFSDDIIKSLAEIETGFVWEPTSVNILQVEVVGESKEILKKMLEARQVEYTNYIKLEQNKADNQVTVDTAEAQKQKTIKEAEAAAKKKELEAKALADALTTLAPAEKVALVAKLEAAKDSGADPNIILQGEILTKLKLPENGINFTSIADLLSLITKNK